MFFGAYEPLTVAAIKKYLREGDTFIDVGANIGFISSIAAGIVGTRGQIHSFEPVPRDFERLKGFSLMTPESAGRITGAVDILNVTLA